MHAKCHALSDRYPIHSFIGAISGIMFDFVSWGTIQKGLTFCVVVVVVVVDNNPDGCCFSARCIWHDVPHHSIQKKGLVWVLGYFICLTPRWFPKAPIICHRPRRRWRPIVVDAARSVASGYLNTWQDRCLYLAPSPDLVVVDVVVVPSNQGHQLSSRSRRRSHHVKWNSGLSSSLVSPIILY